MTSAAVLVALVALPSNVRAATVADIYQDMESGNNNDVLTTTLMNASSHPSGTAWYSSAGSLWVSTANHRDLPGPVIVGATTYNGTGGTRTWKFNDNNSLNFVNCSIGGSYSSSTVACFYTAGVTIKFTNQFDTIYMGGLNHFCVLQTRNDDGAGPYLRIETHLSDTVFSALQIKITSGKTYWINMHYDTTGVTSVAAFDPDSGFAQVGSTITGPCVPYDPIKNPLEFGRTDNHGNNPTALSQSYFGQILFDHTNAAFPLLPSGYNDSTAPTAPPVVRDGTGVEQSIALSTTQLSANWDPAWDAESGIAGYQYAIGTTLGGTQIANWTAQKNELTVTKTGLSLTVGQTYYFSVKAINGVGLVGPATNSIGQVVGTDSTPPSAPAAVRDGGTSGRDIDETTTTTGLKGNFDAATDAESGISCYQYAFGTTPGGTDTVNWSNVPANTYLANVNRAGLTLTPGQRYYFSVKAINNAGLTGAVTTSDGQIVVDTNDTTAPSAPPAVRDGTGTDIAYTNSTTQLSANWDNSTDPESGISGYEYAIGTTAGGTQIANWSSNIGYVTTVTKTGLSLTAGQTYYFSVKAVNGKGLIGAATNSNGQTVDASAPSAPATVRDGTGTDISTTASTTQLSANWDASTDAESGISGYQYAIGTTAGGTQTLDFTSLGNVTTVTKTGLALTVGQTYFFSVKAVNGAGLTGTATNSNGQTVTSSAVTYFSDSFDSWGTVHGGAWSSVNGESATHTLDTSTDHARSGVKCLKITDTDTTATTGAYLTKTFSPTISGDVYARFYVLFPTGYGSTNSGCRRRVLRLWTGTQRGQMSFQDGAPIMEEVGAWGSVTGAAISEGTWHCIEMHIAAPSASTLLEFWVDGVRNTTTLTANFSSGSGKWDYIDFGDVGLGAGTNGTGTLYFDVLAVSNAYIDPLP